jgi:hypothetical protein
MYRSVDNDIKKLMKIKLNLTSSNSRKCKTDELPRRMSLPKLEQSDSKI